MDAAAIPHICLLFPMQPDIGIQKKRFQIGGRFSAPGWYSQEPIASYPKVSKSRGDEDGLVGWLLTSFLKTLEDLFNVAHSFLLIARVVFTKSTQLHESLLVRNLFLVASRAEWIMVGPGSFEIFVLNICGIQLNG